MGNCNFKTEKDKETVAALSKSQFQFQYAIGRGGFGKVWRVERKKQKEVFAMKEMSKARVMSKKSVSSVMNELKLLSQIKSQQAPSSQDSSKKDINLIHRFIVNMHYAFQDRENLYLVLDLLTGGDLRFHISRHRKFTEAQTKFYIACILQALEVTHENGIIHRDLKPENLVFDVQGYLKLTDYGIARYWTPDNAYETSGTPGYMAPEVMCRQNHGVAADYFALGVIAFECMQGRRPYSGKSRKEIRDEILSRQVQIKRREMPEGWSLEAADFINKLLQRKPSNRLGLNGNAEVKAHSWFKDFPWSDLNERKMTAPFIPSVKEDNFDLNHVNKNEWKDAEAVKENMQLLRRGSVQDLFKGYYFDKYKATHVSAPSTKQNSFSQIMENSSREIIDNPEVVKELKV